MSKITDFANELVDVLNRMESAKLEAKAIEDAANDAGINVRALRKVAKEMIMDSEKLAKKFEDEHQLEMFRAEVGLTTLKGLQLEAAE